MNKKQSIILALALVTLFFGIFVIIRSINGKEQSGIFGKKLTPEQQQKRNEMLSRRVEGNISETTAAATGTVSGLEGKAVTVKYLDKEIATVNINSATSITISKGRNQTLPATFEDLKIGDPVKITYDKATKDAKTISIVRLEMPKF